MGEEWHRTGGGLYIFYGEANGDHQLGTGFFIHKRIVSVVRRVEFISDRLSYIILSGCWCSIIILNVHVHVKIRVMM
jgi:hypothetical protein